MALTKCSECGREVSDKAAACPQCGAPVATQTVAPSAPPPLTPTAVPTPVAKPKKTTGVRVATVVLLAVLAGIAYFFVKVATGSSVRSAVAGPETIISETVALNEGEGRQYAFTLPTQRRVEVAVTANPKRVNVFLMNEQDWQAYEKVRKKLLGGKFTHRQALSAESVLNMKQSDTLPAGSWRIVIERPSESLFGGKATAATVSIVAF